MPDDSPVVSIETARTHLRTDGFDDAHVQLLLDAAIADTENILDRPIGGPWTDADGESMSVPAPVLAAVLMRLTDLYEHRDAQGADNTVYRRMLFPYRRGVGV